MKNELVSIKNNHGREDIFTNSKIIADKTDYQHGSITKILRRYENDFLEFGPLDTVSIGINITLGIVTKSEKILVSSRVLAEKFEKEHFHVIRDIENLIVGVSRIGDTQLNNYFIESDYIHSDKIRKILQKVNKNTNLRSVNLQ